MTLEDLKGETVGALDTWLPCNNVVGVDLKGDIFVGPTRDKAPHSRV
jgi:hypothetical protein